MRFDGLLDKTVDSLDLLLDNKKKLSKEVQFAVKAVLDITGFSVGARQAEAQRIQKTENSEDSEDMAEIKKKWIAEDEARLAEYDKKKNSKQSIQ